MVSVVFLVLLAEAKVDHGTGPCLVLAVCL